MRLILGVLFGRARYAALSSSLPIRLTSLLDDTEEVFQDSTAALKSEAVSSDLRNLNAHGRHAN
jgi:hypothetical protein